MMLLYEYDKSKFINNHMSKLYKTKFIPKTHNRLNKM